MHITTKTRQQLAVLFFFPILNQRKVSVPECANVRKKMGVPEALLSPVRAGMQTLPYLKNVSSDVVPQGPAKAVQYVQHFLLLQNTEEPVQQDL